MPFNTTVLERGLAMRLGIPMYGADPRTFALGTKSGARRIFAEAGVPHPLGVEGLKTAGDLADAIASLRVGNSHDEADELYRKTVAALDSEAASPS